MSQTFKTEAIVLKKRSLLNKDSIVTFFTQEHGKVRTVAKGIKKITSRRLPHTQTGNLLNIVIYSRHDHFYLQESYLISGFSEIKKDQAKTNNLYIFLFILERLLPENQPETPVYNLTKHYLVELSKSKDKLDALLSKYANQLVKVLGYSTGEKPLFQLFPLIEELIHEKIPSFDI